MTPYPTLDDANFSSGRARYLSWHWIFYITSCAAFVVFLLCLVLLQETYEPILERRRQGAPEGSALGASATGLSPSSTGPLASLMTLISGTLYRPFLMLLTEPVIQLLAVYVGFLYGMMYLVLSTFSDLWSNRYNQSVAIGGLHYISLGLGYLLGSQVCAFSLDKIYSHLSSNGISVPEHRLPLAILSAILVPSGLLIYGWAAQYQTFWLVPDLGAVLFSFGVIIGLQCVTNYLLDAYSKYAASAIGAVLLLRGIFGFAMPLFAP